MAFQIPHYLQENFLDENLGNNGFDYDLRSEIHPHPCIRVPALKEYPSTTSALQGLAVSTSPAFEINIEGEIKSFPGLKNFLIFPNPMNSGCPVVILDNHNHAFYFWHWAKQTYQLPTALTLIHIDQHKDSRIPAEMLPKEKAGNLDLIFNYTNQILNVGNFIPPAIKTGLVGNIILVDSSTSLEQFSTPEKPFILDIDLDFFAPEFDYIEKSKKLDLIKRLMPAAALVTIATSPYFIDQLLAHQIIREIFQPS